jgi:hypothetical protein
MAKNLNQLTDAGKPTCNGNTPLAQRTTHVAALGMQLYNLTVFEVTTRQTVKECSVPNDSRSLFWPFHQPFRKFRHAPGHRSVDSHCNLTQVLHPKMTHSR